MVDQNSWRRQWPAILVYLCAMFSLLLVATVDFRLGAISLALSVLLALGLRWRLSDEAAGLLRVRRRRIDLTVLALLGTALLLLAVVVPAGHAVG